MADTPNNSDTAKIVRVFPTIEFEEKVDRREVTTSKGSILKFAEQQGWLHFHGTPSNRRWPFRSSSQITGDVPAKTFDAGKLYTIGPDQFYIDKYNRLVLASDGFVLVDELK